MIEIVSGKFKLNKLLQVLIVLSIFPLFFMAGCAGKGKVSVSPVDNPEHHYKTGVKLFDDGDLNGAMKEFNRAKELDPKYSPAFAGIGLVQSVKKDFDNAFENMEKAKKLAKSKEHRVISHVGMIRIYTAQNAKGWLDDAEDEFEDAADTDPSASSPYYYMGEAYREAGNLDDAAIKYRKVIALDNELVEQADRSWAEIQKIERAEPGTRAGKEISKLKRIDRADVAALFIEELKLEKIFKRKGVEIAKKKGAFAEPTDYENHKLKADIDRITAMNIRGLEAIGKAFEPDKEITKGNFALMIEDILVKTLRDSNLPKKFIGIPSPFSDVGSDYYAFSAIITCTTRGIMEADLEGYFGKDDPVSGADALLTLRRLKEKLRF